MLAQAFDKKLVAPARGAWIEIVIQLSDKNGLLSLPHGERGLKYTGYHHGQEPRKSLPHGERGLKSGLRLTEAALRVSLPARGAWIEIYVPWSFGNLNNVAPHTGSVD